ncbi:PLC-like phosphodiesterase [Earliella scabrosa]|nr:PLC-like phosphodiesterase [Earliella scabrosa]
MRVASFFLAVTAAVASVSGAIVREKRASVCNGRSELCNRSYGNVTFLGAHNSFAASDNPLALGRNQEVGVTAQLNLGVRLLQGQTHMNDGTLNLCHTGYCVDPDECGISQILFDGGSLLNYLKKVNDWLNANPNEVLTLILTNPENVSLQNFWKPAFEQSGVASFAYVPPHLPMKQNEWPTLGQLIDSGKRVVVFLDNGADDDRSVPYLLPQFSNVWETPFSVTDDSFPCKVDRTKGPLAPADQMYMINHSLNVEIIGIILPDRVQASQTNSVNSIMANVGGCQGFARGRAPNFVLLDWVNVGQGVQAVNRLNGFA